MGAFPDLLGRTASDQAQCAKCGRHRTLHRSSAIEVITPIRLNVAKHAFEVCGADSAVNVTIKRRLRRNEIVTFFPP